MKNNMHNTQKIPVVKPAVTSKKSYKDDNTTQQPNNRKPSGSKPEQNGKKSFKQKCISLLLIIAIILLTVSVGALAIFSRVNYEPVQKGITINTDNITHNIYNVLLIGADKEENGGSRSDSMILITINKNTNKIKMTSFMRDLWVEIPDHSDGRLNAAYSIGGAGLLMETIEHNFDIQIDDYVLVDFEMFKELIDELGGITVEITEKEAQFINRTTKATVSVGENTLNGSEALIYCRIRKLDSDFMRTQRQRKVMSAIINKIKSQNVIKTASAGISILPLITTDISGFKMLTKSFSLISAISYDVEQLRIPANNTYKNKTINSQAVLVADLEENIEGLHNFIYN